MKKQMMFKTKGMNLDLSVSAFNPEFAFENMNLRLSTNEGNTTMSWVNERGTSLMPIIINTRPDIKGEDRLSKNNSELVEVGKDKYTSTEIKGIPIGTAVINHQLVLFTSLPGVNDAPNVDRIYVISKISDEEGSTLSNGLTWETLPGEDVEYILQGTLLCELDLNFSPLCPIETIVSYESNTIQKVYWTDGRNQPRMINITKDITEPYKEFSFDFIGELQLNEEVTVLKIIGGNGAFPAGVIQYAFTYYLMNGLESNIFYTTPLLYISPRDRGGRPDEKVDNAFKITIDKLDTNYEYLRIYSIIRTSLDSTPLCKRILDISIAEAESYTDNDNDDIKWKKTTYTDTGYSGDSIDPTELLYKGGESVVAKTIEQKDGTLFLGNLIIDRTNINTTSVKDIIINNNVDRKFYPEEVVLGNYAYNSQLTALNPNKNMTVPCAGFKKGDYYRLGVQFLYKTGKWSDPIFIKDEIVLKAPSIDTEDNGATPIVKVPVFIGTIQSADVTTLVSNGYKKVRAVVVYPDVLDRVTVCQGIGNVAMNAGKITDNRILASWFFRPIMYNVNFEGEGGSVSPYSNNLGHLPYMNVAYDGGYEYDSRVNPSDIRQVEIQGHFGSEHDIDLDQNFATINSPEIDFEDSFSYIALAATSYRKVGFASFTKTSSNIEIQTETPTISTSSAGATSKSFDKDYSYGIVAGPFYEDWLVNDTDDMSFERWSEEKNPVLWMIYPWQRNGSLNNDIDRPAGKGVRSAVLKKKVISNLRYAKTVWNTGAITTKEFDNKPTVFNSDEVTILKFGTVLYQGNVDTLLSPNKAGGLYFGFGTKASSDTTNANCPAIDTNNNVNTSFTSPYWWMTSIKEENGVFGNAGVYKWALQENSNNNNELEWNWWFQEGAVGDKYQELALGRFSVRMKYKSTKHLVASSLNAGDLSSAAANNSNRSVLPIIEVIRKGDDPSGNSPFYRATMFGGNSNDALKENTWIPCGEPVKLSDTDSNGRVTYEYSYGDTYFQRWECMKTYPFTNEDVNQIIEIGSFMLETHVNIDGRYDRNRGLLTNVSPLNFNLLNPVYTQRNNFFSYKYLQDTNTEKELYLNLITWTKTKESGADVDLWTNITLASVLELDGDKGEINKLIRFNDLLLAFQDTGISLILYNESVQVSTENGIPVELANSGKVQGKRYLSDTVGCSNKWSMAVTPSGIYFIDSHDRSIYLFNEGLTNISLNGGMDSWCKNNITLTKGWYPERFLLTETLNREFVSYYDRNNKDVLFINGSTALAYSEKLGTFTSFYSYGGAPYLCTLDDLEIWINRNLTKSSSVDASQFYLWLHQGSDSHCKMFEVDNPYYTVLIGNPEPTVDKTFTNLDFRACVQGDGVSLTKKGVTSFKNFYLPFDNIEVWNEYQHGISKLNMSKGRSLFIHNYTNSSNVGYTPSPLSRKFRIWRCDIPRDNYPTSPDVKEYEASKGITRFKSRPLDRIRNPWVYIKLTKDISETSLPKAEIHDIVLTYFD